MEEITFGTIVKDMNTGFKGKVIARCEYDYGLVQFLVLSAELHKGKRLEEWINARDLSNG